ENCYEHKRNHSSDEGNLSESIYEHGRKSVCSSQYAENETIPGFGCCTSLWWSQRADCWNLREKNGRERVCNIGFRRQSPGRKWRIPAGRGEPSRADGGHPLRYRLPNDPPNRG